MSQQGPSDHTRTEQKAHQGGSQKEATGSATVWHDAGRQHLWLAAGTGTEVLRILTGCDTALPVEGDRMSSPPPISVMSCTGVQGLDLSSCIVRADKKQRHLHFCRESHPVAAQLSLMRAQDKVMLPQLLSGALAVRLAGAPGCRSPGWLRSAA